LHLCLCCPGLGSSYLWFQFVRDKRCVPMNPTIGWDGDLTNFSPSLAWKFCLPNLHPLSSWDYRLEAQYLAALITFVIGSCFGSRRVWTEILPFILPAIVGMTAACRNTHLFLLRQDLMNFITWADLEQQASWSQPQK
jgi:hypothetical protein